MKKISITLTASITVPEEYYDGMTNEEIIKVEKNNYQEWILENIEYETLTVIDV